jgi:hypothetical protein
MIFEAVQLLSASLKVFPSPVPSRVDGLRTLAEGFPTEGNSMSRFLRVNSIILQNSLREKEV